jgi:RNA polymerase sigma-70 factor (ECF subfamily)
VAEARSGEPTDKELVEQFKAGDTAAFETLVVRHQRRVYNLAFRITGLHDEAQELAQEIFLKVYQKLHTFRGDAAFTTWLHQVCANHSKNRLKFLSRRKYFHSESIDQPIERAEGSLAKQYESPSRRPDQELSRAQTQQIVQEKIAELPEEQRIVVIMRDIEELDYDEIAEATGLALGTVKSRIHRGRLELKRKLAFLFAESKR